MPRVRLFFDGGCRPNPGRIELAVVGRGVRHLVGDAGWGDNSDAEWLALIAAAEIAARLGADDVELVGDSAVIVAQANGARCRRDSLVAHRTAYLAAIDGIARVRVRRVARSHNLAGIALAAAHPR